MRALFIIFLVSLLTVSFVLAVAPPTQKIEGTIELTNKELNTLKQAGYDDLLYGKTLCTATKCTTPIYYNLKKRGVYYPLISVTIAKENKNDKKIADDTLAKTALMLKIKIKQYEKEIENRNKTKTYTTIGGKLNVTERNKLK